MTVPSEHAEQVTVINWFDRIYPKLSGRLFAIPNGAHLAGNKSQRAKQVAGLKSEGLRVGVPDLMLPVAACGYHGLFIEMKRQSGSSTSKEQKEWLAYLNSAGYLAVVCKGFDEAKAVIEGYLNAA